MFKQALKILICTTFALTLQTACYASEIPSHVQAALNQHFTKVNIRFDGLIQLSDGTQYLPVYPAQKKECDNPGDIALTLPKNSKLESMPDLIMFKDNFTLLKIIRKPGEKPTLLSSNDVPLQVKLGLLPQDLLVPENLVIPTELRILLGDLIIPVRENNDLKSPAGKNNLKTNPIKNVNLVNKTGLNDITDLKNVNFYVASNKSNKISILDPLVGRPSHEIPLGSVPTDLKLTRDGRYILATALSGNKIYVMDSMTNSLIKEIPVGSQPSVIAVADRLKKAYVANRVASTISVIDTKSMEVVKNLNVKGNPKLLALSFDQETLFYVDAVTNSIYKVTFSNEYFDEYKVEFLTKVDNVSSILFKDGNLYITSRTGNELHIYNVAAKKETAKIPVGSKPIDVVDDENNIYVLNAGSDSLSIINPIDTSVIKTVELKSGGFPIKIHMLGLSNKALVTTANTNEIVVFDLEKKEVENKIPVSVSVGSFVILSK